MQFIQAIQIQPINQQKKRLHVFYTDPMFDKRPQAKCPPTCEMSVCGEYVNMYVKKSEEMANSLPSPLSKYTRLSKEIEYKRVTIYTMWGM